MRILHHFWLSPFCRKVRILMEEKGLEYSLVLEPVWERREEFLALNPAGQVPVLIEEDETVISDSAAICEYLDEIHGTPSLIGSHPKARAEARRIIAWFDGKFQREVTSNLVHEKVNKRFLGLGAPSSAAVRAGSENIHIHLDYIAYLSEQRNWLAGDDFSLADIAAAAHISALDYIGDVPWADHRGAKDWYARVKSRPSMRPVLGDHIPGFPPPRHYADLDF